VLGTVLLGAGVSRLVEFVSVVVAPEGKVLDRGVRLISVLLVSAMEVSLELEVPLPY
jgi:hypothetical protein